MRRGDLVAAAAAGDYGKPRPYVVVQSDAFPLDSVSLCPLTTDLRELTEVRVRIEPDRGNGLEASSTIMVDKIVTIRRERVGRRIGAIDEATGRALARALMVFLGLT